MQEEDLSRFATLIVGIGELYGKTFTANIIEIYWSALRDYSFAEVKEARDRHLKNPDVGRYLPKPADIVAAICGNSKNQAFMAWSKVEGAIRRVGSYTSVAFDDALIHAVINDMGGWQRLCSSKNEQLPFIAKEFQERYRGYVVLKPTAHPKYFAGIIESQNSVYGYIYDAPVLIGDSTKAREVLTSGIRGSPFARDLLFGDSRSKCNSSSTELTKRLVSQGN